MPAPAATPTDPDNTGSAKRAHHVVPARSLGLQRDWRVCEHCGLIEPRGGFTKPCRGRARVALRDAAAA